MRILCLKNAANHQPNPPPAPPMKTRPLLLTLLACLPALAGRGEDWISLFDGQTLNGWEPSENKATWRVEDGALVSRGPRSHLFYNGPVKNHEFKNFEVRAEVKTLPGSNSGLYLHTHYQETGFPETGYECQVINSNETNRPGGYAERKLTGSIYAIRNVWKSPARDNEWFRYRARVQGKTLQTFVNDVLVAEYTESDQPFRPKGKAGRLLRGGTIALQGHDEGSTVWFRKLEVKPLADDLPTPGRPQPDAAFEERIVQLGNDNFPLLDWDVHLGNGLTAAAAAGHARQYGYTYGFVFNGGAPAAGQLPPATYTGLAPTPADPAKGGSGFDYVIAPAPAPLVSFTEPQRYMDELVAGVEQLAAQGRVQILARATALPPALQADYAKLWTEGRMDRVIKALKSARMAVEINERLRTPGAEFIRRAKAAGLKFAFGSDNTGAADLSRLEYSLDMVKECKLGAGDVWLP